MTEQPRPALFIFSPARVTCREYFEAVTAISLLSLLTSVINCIYKEAFKLMSVRNVTLPSMYDMTPNLQGLWFTISGSVPFTVKYTYLCTGPQKVLFPNEWVLVTQACNQMLQNVWQPANCSFVWRWTNISLARVVASVHSVIRLAMNRHFRT